ncbi:hypothetical protein BAMY6614_10065 [Bacillus amyloliquefaciens UMAF6614]|nr:hypothetical protein BAMY6614_10065 [Bacillus amyloliquefaciens UMAF6614]
MIKNQSIYSNAVFFQLGSPVLIEKDTGDKKRVRR